MPRVSLWIALITVAMAGCDQLPDERKAPHSTVEAVPSARTDSVESLHSRKRLEVSQRFKEAQDAIADLSREQRAELVGLLSRGQKVDAIARFREMTGADLVLAKDAIESIMAAP